MYTLSSMEADTQVDSLKWCYHYWLVPVDFRLLEGIKNMGFFPLRMTGRCLGEEGVGQLSLGMV